MSEISPGRYRHHKGKEYTVFGIVRHSETLEKFVVYRQEYGDHGLWVRPLDMFQETVKVEGREVPRFQLLTPENEDNPEKKNFFADLPQHLPQELMQTILTASNLRIERIVSHSHASPEGFWYDQDQHEWVIVLQGKARLRFDDRMVEMGPGDYLNIPACQKHRVEWTTPNEPTIWLAVHYGEQGTIQNIL